MEIEIRKATLESGPELLELYTKVAGISDGIIRNENEITKVFIEDLLGKSIGNGLILTALIESKIVGEIHAYTPDIFAFQHILTDLTIVVDPAHQGKGIGRKLFEVFLNKVSSELTHIKRIELYTREYNKRNVKFYESLGFINEGRQKDKIFVSASEFETPLHMAWFNSNYGRKS
ncbi:GNAT family N-acetyltransferase [Poritiphilus flavus]|uniref:GNAT family N-acetyltransferase n=1 Tax=Poritiphilus flavus TaxID=2697053 RepID=A0A6L9EI70_9FLAO|nr:GNAT family N-acetyltransferase [Poritiphilus flavus]NAS13889.1 GNAT family N-acetyltransferase [Poritiphilus flavus]